MRRLCVRHGFTLVELLVVISVISILMTMLVPGIGAIREKVRRAMTNAMISSIGLSLSQYFRDEGVYPPDHDEVRDKCSETIVFYLGGPSVNRDRKGTGDHLSKTYFEFSTNYMADFDKDRWQELVDPWDHPMIYSSGKNGGWADQGRVWYYGDKDCSPRHRRDSYDMYSIGPDGKTGEEKSGGGDKLVFQQYPKCLQGDVGGSQSFYRAACNDDYDGDKSAPVSLAPGSVDDIANF